MNLSDFGPIALILLALSAEPTEPAPPRISGDELLRILDESFKNTFGKKVNFETAKIDTQLLGLKSTSDKIVPDNTVIEAGKWLPIIKHPYIVVILGKRGSGKTALAYRLLELMKWIAPVFVVGLPVNTHKYLPNWIEIQPSLDMVPPNSIVMVDESYIQYHSHSSLTEQSKELSQMLNLSRQRSQTLIFVSQESRHINRNILSAADVLIYKEPGLFQPRFDRPELREIASQANQTFQSFIGNRKAQSFVYTQEQGFIGLMHNSTPSFWSDKLSRAFAFQGVSKVRPSRKTTRIERQAQAKEYERMGLKRAQISRMMGLSKATIKNYLDDYPYQSKGRI